ncbi:hypothetical protein FA95DRAFT_672256 [Auriscalpium vulgare]|uniref:Uncharacterized protein n=1 Tax=Auriscalpium vulgare TaxID=40419 RepID=A0ACB8RDH0_9AGAM|nr:hypothetical protein FA95DRAFT_672256 [Auriscalpium vulgare]
MRKEPRYALRDVCAIIGGTSTTVTPRHTLFSTKAFQGSHIVLSKYLLQIAYYLLLGLTSHMASSLASICIWKHSTSTKPAGQWHVASHGKRGTIGVGRQRRRAQALTTTFHFEHVDVLSPIKKAAEAAPLLGCNDVWRQGRSRPLALTSLPISALGATI